MALVLGRGAGGQRAAGGVAACINSLLQLRRAAPALCAGLCAPLQPQGMVARSSVALLQRLGMGVVCRAARRALLVKRRAKLPARQRHRPKFQDVPRRIEADPRQPAFSGTVLTAISSSNGPRQLLALVRQFDELLSGQHVAEVLSRLAGFATSGGLDEAQAAAVVECGERCTALLRRSMAGNDPLDLARAAYAMHRLSINDPEVLTSIASAALPQLSSFQGDALCGLGAALGAAPGITLPPSWLQCYCLETYVRMQQLTAQDLANCLGGLEQLGHCPSAAWLAHAQRRLREVVPVSGANPPALVKILWALAELQARPSFNWLLFFTQTLRTRIDMFNARELAALAWALARLRHTPDPLFVEAWFRAATRQMAGLTAPALVLAVHAAACWGLDASFAPPGRFLAAFMPQAQSQLPELSGPQISQLLWSCVSLRIRPDAEWLDDACASMEGRMQECGPGDVVDAVWALARLRFQPSDTWEQAAAAQVTAQLPHFAPAQLGALMWAWRSVELTVPAAWEEVFVAAAAQVYTPTQLQDMSQVLELCAAANSAPARRSSAAA